MYKNKKTGFTLIEMLIVIILIGLLSAVVLPRFLGVTTNAQRASNAAVVASLNSAVAEIAAKISLPGILQEVDITLPGNNLQVASVFNIDNTSTMNTNNFISFIPYVPINDPSIGLIPIGGAQGPYPTGGLIYNSTLITNATLPYRDITSYNYATGGCINLFTVLMGSSSVSVAASGTTSSAYQNIIVSPANSTAFTLINGATGSSFSSGSIASGVLASSVLTSNANPGTSGACLYQMNNSSSPTFYIIYDASKGVFYTAEL